MFIDLIRDNSQQYYPKSKPTAPHGITPCHKEWILHRCVHPTKLQTQTLRIQSNTSILCKGLTTSCRTPRFGRGAHMSAFPTARRLHTRPLGTQPQLTKRKGLQQFPLNGSMLNGSFLLMVQN